MLKFREFTEYKKAFTLAEVLITLAVIGVVATLTIPVLMQNADEKATVTALKKAYATLSQAYKLAEQEYGTPDTWGLSTSDSPTILSNFKPYLNINKDCINGSTGCFPANIRYKLLGTTAGLFYNAFDNMTNPKLILSDGTLLLGYSDSQNCVASSGSSPALQRICGRFFVDVNGFKSPNQFGKDTFEIWLTKYGLIPFGTPNETTNFRTFLGACIDQTTATGEGCAGWVIYNQNLDYLHCNTLSWGGQTSCNY